MPDGNVQIGAKFAVPIPYIDENGEGQTCADYTIISNDMYSIGIDGKETWYVVDGEVTINHGLEVKGDVHLIVADDASLTTVNGSFYDYPYKGTDYLTIYGQEKGNGKLNLTGGYGFSFYSSLTINGGEIDIDAKLEGFYIMDGSLTINGGKVNVEGQNEGLFIDNGSLTINGGEIVARSERGDGISAFESTITFGWIRPEDHIYLDCPNYDLSGSTVGIASGQTLTDGGITYTGSNINVDDLNNKTLFGVDVLYDDDYNDIASLNGKHTNVLLSGRTLYTDGHWNTLCLPFDLKLSGSVLDGDNVELMTLGDASFSNGTLTLDFVDADEIKAGVPYIIRWNGNRNIVNPVFKNVTIDDASLDENAFTKNDVISFKGIYSPFEITEANNKLLYLGDDNQIYYPSAAMTINAFRAYFELQGDLTAGEPVSTEDQEIKSFVLNFGEETGISEISKESRSQGVAGGWYSLDGRLLDNPSSPGLYIHNGSKVLIK